jgi:hypothetical protein
MEDALWLLLAAVLGVAATLLVVGAAAGVERLRKDH